MNNTGPAVIFSESSLWVDGHRHGWAGWPLGLGSGSDYVAGWFKGREDRSRIEMKLHVEGALARLRADRERRGE